MVQLSLGAESPARGPDVVLVDTTLYLVRIQSTLSLYVNHAKPVGLKLGPSKCLGNPNSR